MTISFQTSVFLTVLLTLIAFGAAIVMYRYTVPPVSSARRRVLIALRGTALATILLALCEPLLQFSSRTTEPPVIALAVDASLSMTQKEKNSNREAITREVLSKGALQPLSSAAEIQWWKFAVHASRTSPDSLEFNGAATNIAEALHTITQEPEPNVQGILLVTDGNYNIGSNPLYTAEKIRVPLFIIGIGDTLEQKDISISQLRTNDVAYVETSLPVESAVKVSGIGKTILTVTLSEDNKIIAQHNIETSASENITEYPFQFTYTPESAGIKKLRVSVQPLNGELTEKNNNRSVMVKVLKNKLRVVLLAGAPNADVAAVTSTLQEDRNIEPILFTQKLNGEFYSSPEGKNLQQLLPSADCVIMIGFPAQWTSQGTLQFVSETIKKKQLPLLFIASRTIDLGKLRLIESILPFTVSSERMDEQSIFAVPVKTMLYHPIVSLSQVQTTVWDKLPPVYYSIPTFKAKPEASTLFYIALQGVPIAAPFMLMRTTVGSRTLAITGYGIFRWKLLAAASEETKNFFPVWLSAVTRWLSTRDSDKRLRVEPTKEFFAQGESIDFSAQAYNDSYEPIDNVDIALSLHSLNDKSNEATVAFQSNGTGLYSASAGALPEGEYSFLAVSSINGNAMDSVRGRFSIGEQQLEFAETKMNKPLLQQMAKQSGGMFVDAHHADALVKHIAALKTLVPQEKISTSEFALWNLPAFLSFIILLFGVEWFLRKRFGML